MRRLSQGLLLPILLIVPLHFASVAQEPSTNPTRPAPEPLVKKVAQAIERGKKYLYGIGEKNKGHWEVDGIPSAQKGGETALAMLALLNAGVSPDDPVMQKGLKYLEGLEPGQTYVVGLQTMVFAFVNKDNRYTDRIQKNVDWLIATRVRSGKSLLGWGYGADANKISVNGSNTQYVLLGLHEAINAGAVVPPEVLEEIQTLYKNSQRNGGWPYQIGDNPIQGGGNPTRTMTCAGLCGLLITGMDLNAGRESPLGNGRFENCGNYKDLNEIDKAIQWVAGSIPPPDKWSQMESFYYTLYGLERIGRLSGLRFLGDHDWYREGCKVLVDYQNLEDGSWRGFGREERRLGHDQWPVVNTSFALLFLSKGRTPILISKMTHKGVGDGKIYPDDWNNDRNDARHLVEFASRELFKRTPMGWQVFNTNKMQAVSVDDMTAELMQCPMAYITGHFAPDFGDKERDVLKKYVDEGGFIFAEACCGRPEFDQGFRKLMDKWFGEGSLQELKPNHPIWHATEKFAFTNRFFKLYGIERGCKTVVVYCPDDLSCWWESNGYRPDPKKDPDGKGREAFELGANIIAYATGLEPPPPRLEQIDVAREDPAERKVPPGSFKVAQLGYKGDWQPAKNAMKNLMRHLRSKGGLEVSVEPEETLQVTSKGVVDFKFLYLHGKHKIEYAGDLKALRFNLEEAGGLLFSDACCGSKEFDASFRDFISKVLPDRKLEPIPLSDALFSEELNGQAIKTVRCRTEPANNEKGETGYPSRDPMLEGIKIRGRWVVIYSKYDIGCALENHKSSECLGHDHESALRLGSAVVLYALTR